MWNPSIENQERSISCTDLVLLWVKNTVIHIFKAFYIFIYETSLIQEWVKSFLLL